MKPALLFFTVFLLATACERHEISEDANMQKMLAGVWSAELEEIGGVSTITVGPDGSSVCVLTLPGRTTIRGPSAWKGRSGLRMET